MEDLSWENLRKEVLALNRYPQIIGNDEDIEYPQTKLERAYCEFLWQLDEAIRAAGPYKESK